MKTIIIDGITYRLVPIKKECITHAVFILTMPNCGSWNGKWSGENNLFCIIRKIASRNKLIYKELVEGNYSYNFGDGWRANVEVRFTALTEAKTYNKASKGFCGYEWMVDSILKYNKIKSSNDESK